MECAYFVRRLRSGARTPWVLANIDKTRDVLPNLKRWGESVGFKLQQIQQKEAQPSVSQTLCTWSTVYLVPLRRVEALWCVYLTAMPPRSVAQQWSHFQLTYYLSTVLMKCGVMYNMLLVKHCYGLPGCGPLS